MLYYIGCHNNVPFRLGFIIITEHTFDNESMTIAPGDKDLKKTKTTMNARQIYERGCLLKRAGKLNEALTELSKAIDCDRRYADAYFLRGACHYMLGHYPLAANDMDAAALLGCEEARLWSKFDFRFNPNVG